MAGAKIHHLVTDESLSYKPLYIYGGSPASHVWLEFLKMLDIIIDTTNSWCNF